MADHTPTPWAYRPQEHDDWGVIRTTVANASGWHPVVAVASYVGNPTDDDLGEHRRNKTDPSGANAGLIVRAVNSHEALFRALEDFDNWFCGFDPDKQSSRMEGRKVVIRARAALALARESGK